MHSPAYDKYPDYKVEIIPIKQKLQVSFAGQVLAQTVAAVEVLESRHARVVYFPFKDLDQRYLTGTDLSTHCPFKGDASYWHVHANGEQSDNCLWAYLQPFDQVAGLAGYAAFYSDRVDIQVMS